MNLRYGIFVLLTTIFNCFPAHAQSQFGRYVGVLKHSQIENDQLAKLDFAVSRQNGNDLKLVAFLTVYFGDFGSKEYITYHFDSVTFNLLTGVLVFDQPDQEVTLVVNKFGTGQFEGKLRAASTGDVGILSMSKSDVAVPTRPLIQSVWGEYRGVCRGISSVLQIQSHRSSNDSSRMGDPFGTFDISAQLAEVDPGACLSGSSLCVTRVYDSGTYNFFAGDLELVGLSQKLRCSTHADGLRCGDCDLKRTSNEGVSFAPKKFPVFNRGATEPSEPEPKHPVAAGPVAQLGGTYKGYLFHERLGQYQPVSLNVVTYQGKGQDGNAVLLVSAVSTMYFGGFDSREFITHRLNEKEYPLLASQLVLERIDGDVDAVIQLSHLGNGRAKGVWYSLIFGRVGTFELSNTEIPSLPPQAEILKNLGGAYTGAGWTLDLQIIRDSTPINTVNPYYPLNLKGSFRFQDATANNPIVNGSYDFYTGKLSMILEDNSLFSGYRDDKSSMFLKRPTPGPSRPLLPHRYQLFKRVSP